jgi:tetraacyldisaccharide 4'-kinase
MNWFYYLLSLANRLGCRINNILFNHGLRRVSRAPLPVVSVGNIVFGGSEKTPLVMELLSYFLDKGARPALVTRGYKGKWEKKGGILSDGKTLSGTWKEAGDEPFMVAQSFPQVGIYIGRNRLASCRKATQAGFDVAILDDGFQHRRLYRNLDIVLYDPAQKAALRESFSALERADIILIKKNGAAKVKEKIQKRFPHTKIRLYSAENTGFFRLKEKRAVPVEHLKEKPLVVVTGIARPERFLFMLEQEGLNPHLFLRFPDHHAYPPSSLKRIERRLQNTKEAVVLTTEKDSFKLSKLEKEKNIPVYFTKIILKVENSFYQDISFVLKSEFSQG